MCICLLSVILFLSSIFGSNIKENISWFFRDELSEVENCINLHQLQVNDSSENSQICEVSIKVKSDDMERSFNCTKKVLAAASPYFKAMFHGKLDSRFNFSCK